jgi:hypothetical protein
MKLFESERKGIKEELVMMIRDYSHQENDEQLLQKMDALKLEQEEQRSHDNDLEQTQDDALQQKDAPTEQIIPAFESINDSSDDEAAAFYEKAHEALEQSIATSTTSLLNHLIMTLTKTRIQRTELRALLKL